MAALFTLPKQVPLSSAGLLLPGAKLTFSATGTGTLQNTYQDSSLATPHANPVIADSAGVFAPIYLDPTLPNYRVKLTTAADVLIYQIDGVPSNQNAAQTFRLAAAAPELIFAENDASANNGKIRLRVQAEVFSIDLLNDAESVATTVFSLGRTGTSLGSFNFLSGTGGAVAFLQNASGSLTVLNGGVGLFFYKGIEVATIEAGVFTGTFTGFTATQLLQCQYQIIGSPDGNAIVALTIPAFSATSNATTMTLTGLPAQIAAVTGLLQPIFVTNSGSDVAGNARIVTSSPQVVTFGVGAAIGSFTGSGTKGLPGEWIQLIYKTAT